MSQKLEKPKLEKEPDRENTLRITENKVERYSQEKCRKDEHRIVTLDLLFVTRRRKRKTPIF